jgi:hypothetical protein
MSWKKLLQENKVHRHRTSIQELNEIRRLVARDLADAAIPALSEDRRFATAYNAPTRPGMGRPNGLAFIRAVAK